MALLSTSVTSGTTGHLTNHNQLHRKANGSVVDAVADFAADNTGATSASTAIQAAITAGELAGTPVYIPAGDYQITAKLNVSKPGQVIRGAGWKTNLFFPAGTNLYMFDFTPAGSVRLDGVVIADMRLDCDGPNQTAGGGIQASYAAYCKFLNLQIYEPWGNGIEIHDDNLGGFGHHNAVRDCWFNRGAASNGGQGRAIYMWNSDENMIVNNTIEACGSSLSNGAAVWAPAAIQTFTGNQFVADPSTANVEQLLVSGDMSIMGNVFDGGTNNQLRMTGNASVVTGNRFYRVIAQKYGVRVTGANNSITANAFRSATTANVSGGAIDANGASGVNVRWGNVIETGGAWNGTIYNGTSGELAVATG
jgi:hypothetical protein